MLQAIVKKQGARDAAIVETVRKAKKLLSELGIEIAEKIDNNLPETRTFAEAFKAGRERLDRAESTDATLPILEQQLAKADAETKQNVGDQVKKIKEDSLRDRMQAIELYERALRMFREKDDRSELLEAKYLLSYMFLRTDQYWESVAIAQELVVPASGVDKAENAGGFALLGHRSSMANELDSWP
jgi:tetratricopeptide (TPR) repeat protein